MSSKKDKSKKDKLPDHIILSIYFGVPGSGKTTFAAWLAKRDLKRGINVMSNVPITGAYQLDCKTDLGRYMVSESRIIIDEAGLEYNNRNFKSFSAEETYFFKYHRHYQCAVDVFSQGWDDMDKKIRTLAQRLYVVRRFTPWFIIRKEIKKRVGINETTKDIQDEYYFAPFGIKIIFAPLVWHMFNTTSRKALPSKSYNKW